MTEKNLKFISESKLLHESFCETYIFEKSSFSCLLSRIIGNVSMYESKIIELCTVYDCAVFSVPWESLVMDIPEVWEQILALRPCRGWSFCGMRDLF